MVEVPKDPSKTHPYRQKDVLGRMNAVLTGLKINQFDVKCVNVIYGIKKRPELYYQGTVPGSPVQYSDEFIQWLTSQIRNDPDFFLKTRRKYQEGQSSRSAVPASQAGSAKGNGQGSNGRSGGLVSGGTETGVRRLGDAKPA